MSKKSRHAPPWDGMTGLLKYDLMKGYVMNEFIQI